VVDPIRDEQDNLVGFAKITRDATERRNAQLALQEAQAQRAHAQKMDALGQLTGGVAHDFNNLLMVVSGHIRTLKNAVVGDIKAARAAEAIELAAQRGEALARQLLTFARRQTVNPMVIHVSERVEAFRAVLASSIGGSAQLVTTIGPEVSLINLVLNARDAMANGGVAALTAENVTLAPGDIKPDVEGDFVALHVTDTGVGIAPDVLERVFDPFFTTKQVDKGSGLGLSQVHGFAHQSGGTVRIESTLGKGTTVTLYLPRARADAPAASGEVHVESARGGSVLLVDDNPDVADVSTGMLEQLGYEVHRARDAATALAAIDQHAFDLVVSDIVMPGTMDGLAFARALRERHPALPVLLVTGYSQAAAEAAPEFTVMRKPFQLAELSRAAGRMIAESKQPAITNVVRLRKPVISS